MSDLSHTEYAAAAREKKRAEAESIGVNDGFISDMVERFYAQIRSDPMLGPDFRRAHRRLADASKPHEGVLAIGTA